MSFLPTLEAARPYSPQLWPTMSAHNRHRQHDPAQDGVNNLCANEQTCLVHQLLSTRLGV